MVIGTLYKNVYRRDDMNNLMNKMLAVKHLPNKITFLKNYIFTLNGHLVKKVIPQMTSNEEQPLKVFPCI